MVEVAVGDGADALVARILSIENTMVGRAIAAGRPTLSRDFGRGTDDAADMLRGPTMVIPLMVSGQARGALVVARRETGEVFTDADLEMTTAFAGYASVALELADARVDQQRVILLEDRDRDRIARDLHDHVIQRLFATGLGLQSLAAVISPGEPAQRLQDGVADIDETIRQIRTSIFDLRDQSGRRRSTIRRRVVAVIDEVGPLLRRSPEASFSGPVDLLVVGEIAEDVVAVLREALTNFARHAAASTVRVTLTASGQEIGLEVVDDGVGIGSSERRSGLDNLRQRALRHGGRLDLLVPAEGGTRLRWSAPTPADEVEEGGAS